MVITGSYRIALLQGAALCAALILPGCATVQSRSTAIAEPTTEESAGMTYFLPRRLAKLTATRGPADVAKLIKARDAAAVDLAAARDVLASAKKAHAKAKAVLDTMPEDAAGRRKQEGVVALAKAELDLATEDVAGLLNDHEALELAVRDAQASSGQCIYEAKLELLPAEPDPDRRFIARLRHNWLRDDNATLKVNSAGLLTSGNAVAADRTGDILVEAAGIIGVSQGGGPEVATKGFVESKSKEAPDCRKSQTVIRFFDPVEEPNLELGGGFPLRVVSTFAVGPEGHAPGSGSKEVADRLVAARQGALFYRSPAPVKLVLERLDGGKSSVLDAAVALLPQAGPIGFIPMNSAAFVKTTDDVQFEDGSLASWTTDRPSEVLEVVRLPVKIATALLSAPAQLLSVKVDYSSKAKSLAESQQAQMETQLKLQKLKLCVAQARTDGAPLDKCLSAD